MTTTKIFHYVSPRTTQEIANSICSKLPVKLVPIQHIQDLFPLLSCPKYYTDFVIIDIAMFYQETNEVDVFDIINTLNTLIKSTVYRSPDSLKPVRRDTKIIVLVSKNTDPKLIKEIMTFDSISSIALRIETDKDLENSINHLQNIISGNFSIPKEVLSLLKPKSKKQTANNEITLTTRQAQVMHLLVDRGLCNKLIAKTLNISESTVKLHISSMLRKYVAKNRTQLVAFAKT